MSYAFEVDDEITIGEQGGVFGRMLPLLGALEVREVQQRTNAMDGLTYAHVAAGDATAPLRFPPLGYLRLSV